MANEATVRSSLQIIKSPIEYSSRPATFTADVTGTNGPTPGALAASTTGVDVDLSELTTPGYCKIQNLDDTNYVEYGIWDGATFHELGELLPGEVYVFRFSRNVTGFRVKANTAAVNVVVEAFET